MAQYNKPFYSTGLYGRLNALVGDYETEIFDAQEVFTSNINCEIRAQLPTTFYNGSSVEVKYDSNWTLIDNELQTNSSDAKIEMEAAGDYFEAYIRYQSIQNHKVLIELYQEETNEDGFCWVKKEEKIFDTYSPSQAGAIEAIKFDSYGYANHKIVVTTKSVWEKTFITFVGFSLQTTNIALQLRASNNKKEWTDYKDIPLTRTILSDGVLLSGTSSLFEDVRYIQGVFVLMSSDNQNSPIIEQFEFHSNNSELYDYDGEYVVEINIGKIVNDNNQVFKKVNKIKWEEVKPQGTEITVRSSGSYDGVFWSPISAPYSKSTSRIRLKKGIQKHSIVVGPIDESIKFNHSKIISYNGLESQAYLPKDDNGCSISYVLSKTKDNQKISTNLLQTINNPTKNTITPLEFSPQPYYLTIEMERTPLKSSPVIDFINIYQNIEYKEDVRILDENISSVDNFGTGVVPLHSIDKYSFNLPNSEGENEFNAEKIENAEQLYLLSDQTNRPADIILYFESERELSNRSNKTSIHNDVVMAKTIVRRIENGETQGVIQHAQYNTGNISFLRPIEKEMDSSFTPVLQKDKGYRYYIKNGWPDSTHVVVPKQTLDDIAAMYECDKEEIKNLNKDILMDGLKYLMVGQKLVVPNNTIRENISISFSGNEIYTEKSSHNAVFSYSNNKEGYDFSSAKIQIVMTQTADKAYAEWSSAEKVYSGVLNLGNKRESFIRTQFNRYSALLEREYTVQENDTWENISTSFDVNISDLHHINNNINLEVGTVIKIPASISLPDIPAEVEFEGDRIYNISIVEDSVFKKTGEKLDESIIPIDWNGKQIPLTVTYKKDGSSILTAEIIRGNNKNGLDALPHSQIREIISIVNKNTGQEYVPYSNALGIGDYLLDHNYVSWAPNEDSSLEPEAGETYIVSYIKEEVESISIYLETTYSEKFGADYAWRSPEIKVIEGVCTPNNDFLIELPKPETFIGYDKKYNNIGYLVEDNDIWVETSVKNIDGKQYLHATLNEKNPNINWHPTIHPGYYYLKEDEYYMYSEPVRTTITQKELPHTENIEYITTENGFGALLQPKASNMINDSIFEVKEKKTAYLFTAESI